MHVTVIIFCGLFALVAPAIYTAAEARLRGAQARANRQPIDDAIILATEAVRNMADPLRNCTWVEMADELLKSVEQYPRWKETLHRDLGYHGYRVDAIHGSGECNGPCVKIFGELAFPQKPGIKLCWDDPLPHTLKWSNIVLP